MKPIILAVALSALATGCSTIKSYDAYNSDALNAVRGRGRVVDPDTGKLRYADADFTALVIAIGNDRQLLLDKGKDWNRAEAAFGLALLASSAYGGFSTTYGGNNLKDAAFAAASLATLRTFAAPGDRRNAYYKAGAAMNCLTDAASVFADEPPTLITATFAGDGRASNFVMGQRESATNLAGQPESVVALGVARKNFSDALQSLLTATVSVAPKFEDRPYSMAEANDILTLNLRAERQARQVKTAVVALIANSQSESEIYARRFEIVGTAYMTIIGRLFNETKFTIDAAKVVSDLEEALKKKAAAETAVSNAKAMAANALDIDASSMTPVEDELQKYAKAQAAVALCSAAS